MDNFFGTFVDVLTPEEEAAKKLEEDSQNSTTVSPPDSSRSEIAAELKQEVTAITTYTMEEVEKHRSKDDCWVVVHGRVLNVTNFLPRHPGGERILFAYAGKDASVMFDKMNHPAGVIDKYAPDAVIGTLEGVAAAASADNNIKAPLLAKEETTEGLDFWAMLPTRDYAVYFTFTGLIFLVLWLAIMQRLSLHLYPYSVASLVAFGPVIFALMLCLLFGEKLDFRWPFQHESLFGKLGLHLLVGFLVGVLPVYHLLTTVMAEPAFCQLWDAEHQSLCSGMVR